MHKYGSDLSDREETIPALKKLKFQQAEVSVSRRKGFASVRLSLIPHYPAGKIAGVLTKWLQKLFVCLFWLLPTQKLCAEDTEARPKQAASNVTFIARETAAEQKVATDAYYESVAVIQPPGEIPLVRVGTASIVRKEDIARHNDKTLGDVLQRIPGMNRYTHSKGQMRLRIRGFDQDRMLILIDGVPLNDIYSTDIDLNTIPVVNVQKIIITRGASSALYGTDGPMGTISITTETPAMLFARSNLQWGINHDLSLDFAYGNATKDYHYSFAHSFISSKGFIPSYRLDAEKRRYWFDKIIRYDLYSTQGPFEDLPKYSYEDVLTPAKEQYIYDNGIWNHSEYDKYFLSLRTGFRRFSNLNISANANLALYSGKSNTYQPNAFSSYRGDRWKPNWPYFGDEQEQVKKFALRNRSFVWPLVYRIDLVPCVQSELNDFDITVLPFGIFQQSKQAGYASNDHEYFRGESLLLQGTGIYDPYYDIKQYFSYGIRIVPSYEIADGHTLHLSASFRNDLYSGQEQAIGRYLSPNIYQTKGLDGYPVEELQAQTFSLGIEDKLVLWNTVELILGVSYDVQNFSQFRIIGDEQSLEDQYIVEENAILFGTRDSLNPVIAATLKAVPQRLHLRIAGSIKTGFPGLSEYAKISRAEDDYHLKSERVYNLNTGPELFLLNGHLNIRSDYFISTIHDRIVKPYRDTPPLNVDKVVSQGAEVSVNIELDNVLNACDLKTGIYYTFIHARNLDYSKNEAVNKGDFVEYTPEHQIGLDAVFQFITKTELLVSLQTQLQQRIYVMAAAPPSIDADFSTEYFTSQLLHDPFFLDVRTTQNIYNEYKASISVTNILDDYDANPFDPGPGRMVYIELSSVWN